MDYNIKSGGEIGGGVFSALVLQDNFDEIVESGRRHVSP